MITIMTVADMKARSAAWKAEGRTIGFVPTMGYLHEGHLSLIRESKKRANITAASIFVNPTQFGPKEDFKDYPRDLGRDSRLLEAEGADCLFFPEVEEMYPPGFKTYVEVHDLQDKLCGRSRPGHFRGVCTVVLKLFNIVRPDMAFFGWKDAQQVIILKKMAQDLDCDVQIVGLPLVREADGLAMSSRNAYLNPEERKAAVVLSRSLQIAEQAIREGERDAGRLADAIRSMIEAEPLTRIDYIQVVDLFGLEPRAEIRGETLIALAVFVGSTRLIDNIRIQV